MGYASYSTDQRQFRAQSLNYATKDINDIFEQNKVARIHESMNPLNVIRECRDSAAHPLTVPIIYSLDVTGSMGRIPHYLVKDGLPHLMDGIIKGGVPDASLMFMAVGDTNCDSTPLQVGQFESGDAELDQWLTRTYLEGNGGGNGGESYSLAWYFASKHTVTDAWEKRKQKGFLFTTGDEPCHKSLPKAAITKLMGDSPEINFTDKELLAEAQKQWNVYHLHIMQGTAGNSSLHYWRELLGDNCIVVSDYTQSSKIITDIVTKSKTEIPVPPPIKDEEML